MTGTLGSLKELFLVSGRITDEIIWLYLFLKQLNVLIFAVISISCNNASTGVSSMQYVKDSTTVGSPSGMSLFLCGDVMTGRGVDQILPHSVDPVLYEQYVKDAKDYVLLAENENGRIRKPVSYSYIWGDALKVWKKNLPDLKIINLETSITTSDDAWQGKGINYRMHPKNTEVLTAAGIDFCALANNHVLDWGHSGLSETLSALKDAGIAYAGAGNNFQEARQLAIMPTDKGRVIIFSYGMESSGVPRIWAAKNNRSGVNYLPDLSQETLNNIADQVHTVKDSGDVVIFSVHWGSNWGYGVPPDQQHFARQLIDKAGVDIVHGHSSHHPRGIEVYRDKLILYGAGDFINDYEGIGGQEIYRGDLTLMYFPRIDPASGKLLSLKMVPMQIKNIRLNYASSSDVKWLYKVLNEQGKNFGTSLRLNEDNSFSLVW